MDVADLQALELSSSFIHAEDNLRYNLCVIEYPPCDGKPNRRFGIVENRWCEKSRCWKTTKRQHMFLPLQVWSKLGAFSTMVAQYAVMSEDVRSVGDDTGERAVVVDSDARIDCAAKCDVAKKPEGAERMTGRRPARRGHGANANKMPVPTTPSSEHRCDGESCIVSFLHGVTRKRGRPLGSVTKRPVPNGKQASPETTSDQLAAHQPVVDQSGSPDMAIN